MCNESVLGTATGPVRLRARFVPETIDLKWYDRDTKLTVSNTSNTCEYDTGINLPTTPTRTGYTFNGWTAIPGTRIEYIESTGTQWINTGVTTGIIGVTVDTNVMITDWTGERAFVGVAEVSYLFELYASGANMTLWNVSPNSYARARGIDQNTIHNVKAGLMSSKILLNIDGVDYNTNISPTGGPLSAYTFTLFHLGNIDQYNAKAKMYYFKLYKDGVLMRDMIPIKDTNGIACMYDLVSKQKFYNAGTGNFIAGPDL